MLSHVSAKQRLVTETVQRTGQRQEHGQSAQVERQLLEERDLFSPAVLAPKRAGKECIAGCKQEGPDTDTWGKIPVVSSEKP